jgi:hypothetical protein
MPALRRPLTQIIVALLGTVSTGAVLAQSVIVSNGPTGNNTIPLAANSTVQIDAAGNLLVTCSTSPCAALVTGSGGGGQGSPTSSIARNDNDTDVRAGEFIRLAWTSSGADACAASSTGPSGTTWTGVRGTTDAAGEAVTVSAVGTYVFSFQCFNASGGSTKQNISVAVAAGEVQQPSNCNLAPHALLEPVGWTRVNKSWVSTWSSRDGDPVATYPASVGFPVPVGADKGTYRVTEFTPGVNEVIQISWETVQSNGIQGYPNPRPADAMYFSISPCAGDFRPPDDSSSDGFLQRGCRKGGGSAGMIFHTLGTPSNFQSCQLVAGQKYYMNVIAASPEDGLTSGEHTCTSVANSASGCDVQATHRPAQ